MRDICHLWMHMLYMPMDEGALLQLYCMILGCAESGVAP